MRKRTLTRTNPAPAWNIEEVLDIITYILNIIDHAYSLIKDIFGL